MITAERAESIATDERHWEGAYEEKQQPCLSVSDAEDTTADQEQLGEALAGLLHELQFMSEAATLTQVKEEALRSQAREYFKNCAEQFVAEAPVTIRNAFVHRNISSLREVTSEEEAGQAIYALTSALSYARAELMGKIENFDAWLYLRRLWGGEERIEVPKRFIGKSHFERKSLWDREGVEGRIEARKLLG